MLTEAMIAAIVVAAIATMLTRLGAVALAKSALFSKLNEDTLSRVFPLVILCVLVLKENLVSLQKDQRAGLLQLAGIVIVCGLHLWRRNLFLSVIGGTAIFMGLRVI